ncbi:MAG: anhydro-N-acetylmuramic acid kinase [Pseudomonadota bacterium]
MSKIKTAIGLMSGTSMDGIDAALMRTDGIGQIEFGPTMMVPYEAAFSQSIAAALAEAKSMTDRAQRTPQMTALERELTERHATAVDLFLARNGLSAGEIDLIGFHGQTIIHRPDLGFTVQLGDGQQLADQTGITVVWDMRANDMANGGQGAPLVPVFHQALAKKLTHESPTAFVNIGGIANVTFVEGGKPPIAFDCGPGNALIDQWVQKNTNRAFDEEGALALTGQVDDAILADYLADSFYEENIPKSLDRNDITLSRTRNISAADGAATLVELTAQAIARSQKLAGLEPQTWVISGGGARNAAIMQALERLLPDAKIASADSVGLDGDAMEAQCWAYLAVRAQRGLPLTYPSTTGCDEPCTGGVISEPPAP